MDSSNQYYLSRVVDDQTLDIYKVPYSMKQVPGSFTGEVLCEEVITHISSVRNVEWNASDTVKEKLIENSKQNKMTV